MIEGIDGANGDIGFGAKHLRKPVRFERATMKELERVEQPIDACGVDRHRTNNLKTAALEARLLEEFELRF